MLQTGLTTLESLRVTRTRGHSRFPARARYGAALLMALFVMTVVSSLVVAVLDTQTIRYAALRNTREWDEARYLAEAGLHHALSELEHDIDWRTNVPTTEYPAGSGFSYAASVQDGPNGTVIITATGYAGAFSRVLTATVKQGG
ncbi:MAG: hypothetical protein ACE361_00835 [Aureliella sp.]